VSAAAAQAPNRVASRKVRICAAGFMADGVSLVQNLGILQ
jgi:hypothetical protein